MLFKDRLTIQETCKLTDTTYPVKSYLTTESFPEQDSTKLGTESEILVRSYMNAIDEASFILDRVPYYILRYDKEYPYYTIGICNKPGHRYQGCILIIKNTLENSNDIPPVAEQVVVYPIQLYNYYLVNTTNVYSDFSNIGEGTQGTIVRCDVSNPSKAVIAEITKDNYLRFLVSEEAIILLEKYEPVTELYNETDVYDFIENLLGAYRIYGSTDD